MNDLLTQMQPALMQLAAVVLTGAISVAAARFKQWTGIQIEAKHREALHEALISGVEAAISGNFDFNDVAERAIEHATESVPDAIAYLAPDDAVLRRIAERYIEQAEVRRVN